MDRNQAAESSPLPLFSRPGTMEIIVCSVTALAYLGTLAFGFVYDDVPQILKNPAIHDWRYLPQYFTSHVWAAIYPNSAGNYYRPLFLLWLRLNYALFGENPAGWHGASVLCHVAATYLVFRVAQQLARDRTIAFVAALFFGLHPAHVENVAWISGVTDPLMASCALGSCSAFLSFRESRKASQFVLSLGLFALALLSKETAIVLPLLIVALSLIRPQDRTQDQASGKSKTAAREAAPYALLVLIYIGVRYRTLGGLAHPTIAISWTEMFLSGPSVVLFYVKHLLLPLRLSEFYAIDYVHSATGTSVLLPLCVLLTVGLVLYYCIRTLPQKQVAFFALAVIVLPLLPVLDLRSLTAGDIVHDRYLYLPSAGFALLVALSIAALGQRMTDRQRIIVPAALTGVLALLFAGLTLAEQMQWANDIALYTRGLESAPDNLTVRDNLANALLDANQPSRAVPLYLEVIKRNPNFWRSNYNLGFAYYKIGNFTAARESLQRAIMIDRNDSDQYIYLAIVELQLKKLPEAADSARQAIVRNPQARGYHFILGLICESQGDREAAIAAFKTELTHYPDNAAAEGELKKSEGVVANSRP
ncbi:MAG: tetratricopeptide repeat protein [Acidobacteriia bacterium]|nr:tetratricopeptide repeat protein [Terriglobia bacterium]